MKAREENPPPLVLAPVLLVFASALLAIGFVLDQTWPFIAAGSTATIVLIARSVRHSRTFRPFYRRWKALSESARARMSERRARFGRARTASVLAILVAASLTIAGGLLALRSEIVHGRNLNEPGLLFQAYNRVAAPEIAELVELFVVRNLPLEQADSADLRTLRNLYFAVEGYSFSSEDLTALFSGLVWYRPYRAFPNDINALPDPYRQRVQQIIIVEESRG